LDLSDEPKGNDRDGNVVLRDMRRNECCLERETHSRTAILDRMVRLGGVLAVALVVPACGNEPNRRYPGPCSSIDDNQNFPMVCTLGYEAERLVSADCERQDLDGEASSHNWVLTYGGEKLTSLVYRSVFTDRPKMETWTFAEDAVRVTAVYRETDTTITQTWTQRHEPDLELQRHPFELFASPYTHHAIVYDEVRVVNEDAGTETGEEHTYTYDGPVPRPGTRTQTRDDGMTFTFTHDERGRLVDDFFEYDGELLVRIGSVSYEHDSLGNLLRRVATFQGETLSITTYDYSCWD